MIIMPEMEPLLNKTKHIRTAPGRSLRILYGPLDVTDSIDKAVGGSRSALIATCGPKSLMTAVKDSANHLREHARCHIDTHIEDFDS